MCLIVSSFLAPLNTTWSTCPIQTSLESIALRLTNTSIENLDDFAAFESSPESRDANVGRRLRPFHLVHLLGLVVQHDADEDDGRAEAGQEGDRVAEDDHGKPDQQHSFGRVGNTAKKRK